MGHGDGVSGGPLTPVLPPRPLLGDHSPGLGLHKGPATHPVQGLVGAQAGKLGVQTTAGARGGMTGSGGGGQGGGQGDWGQRPGARSRPNRSTGSEAADRRRLWRWQ